MNASQVTRRQRGRATASALTSTWSLRKIAFEDGLETPLAVALDGAALVRKRHAGGELAQQLEQRQIRPRGRFEAMRLRLRNADRPARDGDAQDGLELAEGGLPLHHSAQVVLIEVEEELGRRGPSHPPGATGDCAPAGGVPLSRARASSSITSRVFGPSSISTTTFPATRSTSARVSGPSSNCNVIAANLPTSASS
jgi:hypothetical protein